MEPRRYAAHFAGIWAGGSVRLDVRALDDRPPFGDLGLVERGERRGILLIFRWDDGAEIGQPLAHRRVREGLLHRAVELSDRILRRALGNPQTMPERDVHARHA